MLAATAHGADGIIGFQGVFSKDTSGQIVNQDVVPSPLGGDGICARDANDNCLYQPPTYGVDLGLLNQSFTGTITYDCTAPSVGAVYPTWGNWANYGSQYGIVVQAGGHTFRTDPSLPYPFGTPPPPLQTGTIDNGSAPWGYHDSASYASLPIASLSNGMGVNRMDLSLIAYGFLPSDTPYTFAGHQPLASELNPFGTWPPIPGYAFTAGKAELQIYLCAVGKTWCPNGEPQVVGKITNFTQVQMANCPGATPPVTYSWTTSDFGACSAPCGGGIQTRTVACTGSDQSIDLSGAQCASQTAPATSQSCNTQGCPVNCVVGDWSAWSACSATACGTTGTQTQTRSILTQPANGGTSCPDLTNSQSCSTAPCPIDCVVASAGFDACSASCGGGTQTELLTILTPTANGGAACRAPVVQACNTQSCDTDGDGVLDTSDICPGTATGSKVDAGGCSGAQLVEKSCPASGSYKNHGAYVSCVAQASGDALEAGLLTSSEKDAIVSAAAQSSIGK